MRNMFIRPVFSLCSSSSSEREGGYGEEEALRREQHNWKRFPGNRRKH